MTAVCFMPKVSVVMSVFNNEAFLEKAIKSILEQTFKDFEFLIVDDVSTDSSLEIIKKFASKDKRIKILANKERLGLTKSLNKTLRQAKGRYIGRMDADDISLKERLNKQVNFLDSHPEIVILGSWVILIDEKGNKLRIKKTPTNYKEIYQKAIKENSFIHPTLMFRRSVLEKVGFYDKDFLYAQDYELVLRILEKHQGANIAQPLLLYRVGSKESISVKKLKNQEFFALKARWKALSNFSYPLWQAVYLIKPLLSFLLPVRLKLFIYKKFFWR